MFLQTLSSPPRCRHQPALKPLSARGVTKGSTLRSKCYYHPYTDDQYHLELHDQPHELCEYTVSGPSQAVHRQRRGIFPQNTIIFKQPAERGLAKNVGEDQASAGTWSQAG